MNNVIKLPVDAIGRAIRICFIANVVSAAWGRRGWGKTSIYKQVVPEGWEYYPFYTSDKEPQDIGGIPFPVEYKVNGKSVRQVEYLMTKLLPFGSNKRGVVVFEEFDRADLSVQNPCLQVLLEKEINGHKLGPQIRMGVTGNASTDIGTNAISDAHKGRMCHLYVETEGDGALNSWLNWAKTQHDTDEDPFGAIPPGLQSFAKYKQDVWTEGKDVGELEEYGSPTPRTFVMAGKLWRAAQKAKFETADVILPVLAGCVGSAAGRELLKWFEVEAKAPKIEDIIANPNKARLPDDNPIFFALGLTIARYAKTASAGNVDAFATYIARWPDEQAGFAYTHLLGEQERAATSAAYIKWQKSR
jgi:hypothetical protein